MSEVLTSRSFAAIRVEIVMRFSMKRSFLYKLTAHSTVDPPYRRPLRPCLASNVEDR